MTSTSTSSTGDELMDGLFPGQKIAPSPDSGQWRNDLARRRHWLEGFSTRFQPDDGDLTDEELYYKYRDKYPY